MLWFQAQTPKMTWNYKVSKGDLTQVSCQKLDNRILNWLRELSPFPYPCVPKRPWENEGCRFNFSKDLSHLLKFLNLKIIIFLEINKKSWLEPTSGGPTANMDPPNQRESEQCESGWKNTYWKFPDKLLIS